ncbi:hypothetical protein [Prosthecobacter sp.]|uniref:hypothetical protein n=1 Tax=Prosthecobacter sp. TaxID=1965333 RepID=UPI0037833885
MKTKLLLAALLASVAVAQATPAMSTPKGRTPGSSQRSAGRKVASGPFLNHPDSAPGPH